MRRIVLSRQHDSVECGLACLRMVSKFHGKPVSMRELRSRTEIGKDGTSLLSLVRLAEGIGFRARAIRTKKESLTFIPPPFIAHWKQNHFVVVAKATNSRIKVADPALGWITYSLVEFCRGWQDDCDNSGILLLLEPSVSSSDTLEKEQKLSAFNFLIGYLQNYREHAFQFIIGLIFTSFISFAFPFLTAAIIDVGLKEHSMPTIYLLLVAQLMLFAGRRMIEFTRGWMLANIGARVGVSLISDFLAKMMRQPLAFFDSRLIGDVLQRIDDHRRVEEFITTTMLNVVASIFSLLVIGAFLLILNPMILLVFTLGTLLGFAWVALFLRKQRQYDQQRFSQRSETHGRLIQMFSGIQDIKVSGAERSFRWKWEDLQSQLFWTNIRRLNISQIQRGGLYFITEVKNITIIILAASSVLGGQMTLGMMMAITFAIGQLSGPIDQLTTVLQVGLDTQLSLDRLAEVHSFRDEGDEDREIIREIPLDGNLQFERVSFRYKGAHGHPVLDDLSLTIPCGKMTAIVGVSGSGKTTLLKLLMQFYSPDAGTITLGGKPLDTYDRVAWRRNCGVVLQEGFIFSDTVLANICLGEEIPSDVELKAAIHIANVGDFLKVLPLGLSTRIGRDGYGLSQGQKQRILIARAVYKNPKYVFFDEATNSLDASTEKAIVSNLREFLQDRTSIVIAHRLSTVRHADQIVVLKNGRIDEVGTHEELCSRKSAYFNLIKDQLELGA